MVLDYKKYKESNARILTPEHNASIPYNVSLVRTTAASRLGILGEYTETFQYPLLVSYFRVPLFILASDFSSRCDRKINVSLSKCPYYQFPRNEISGPEGKKPWLVAKRYTETIYDAKIRDKKRDEKRKHERGVVRGTVPSSFAHCFLWLLFVHF